MSDGKKGKILVVDEFHSEQGGFFKLPNGAYAHYSCGNPETEKELSKKLGKGKVRKVPLSNGKSCTDFLKLWERIKESENAENKG
jgi:hypothetical protein